MAGQKGQKYNINQPQVEYVRRTPAKRAYFYIDGVLYKSVYQNRAGDVMRAWCFEEERMVDFVLSDVKRRAQQAFDTRDVGKLLNRNYKTILMRLSQGAINKPYMIYRRNNPMNNLNSFQGRYKWSEDDVLALHDFYLSTPGGRPRKDGLIQPGPRLPTRLELIAMMKQNRLTYIQDGDGNFVPLFDQPDWT
jgi:uncharacterized protein (DUF1778 family)